MRLLFYCEHYFPSGGRVAEVMRQIAERVRAGLCGLFCANAAGAKARSPDSSIQRHDRLQKVERFLL